MHPQSLSDWLSYIESQHPNNIELGLDRCSAVLAKLGFDRPSEKIFTISGTNGKGSTCTFLTHYLGLKKHTVGTFTSPHFVRFNERIAINGEPVSDEIICQAFAHIEQVRGDIALTYFEFNTLAAVHIFSNAKLDYWVLEVGLGGRLDSVNMIDADVAAVTSISLDHIDWLGDSLDIIAQEKAGIARAGKLLISGVNQAPDSLRETALTIGADFKQKGEDYSFSLDSQSTWSWQGNGQVITDLPVPNLPVENAATVLAVLSYSGFKLDFDTLKTLMLDARLTGRFQTLMQSPQVILDVAHNPEAALELQRRLSRSNKNAIAVCGMLHDKDIESVLTCLKNNFSQWYLADLDAPRGASADQLSGYLENYQTFSDVASAFDAAVDAANKQDALIVVFGSFVTVADCITHHITHY
jgi:dihydrofolate synthase/folylpolyglutamate synthase